MLDFIFSSPVTLTLLMALIMWGILVFSVRRGVQRLRNSFLLINALMATGVFAASLFGDDMGYALLYMALAVSLALLVTPVLLIANGLIVFRRERRSLQNSLSILLGMAIAVGEIATFATMLDSTGPDFLHLNRLMGFVAVTAFYFSFVILAFVLYSVFIQIIPRRTHFDYVIIHGCGLKKDGTPTKLLSDRIDKAIEVYRRSGEGTLLIPSGGKGRDEIQSEAASMADYLKARGVPEKDILLENRSTTTMENLKYSMELMGCGKNRVALISSNYHVYRCLMYARQIGLKCTGIGSHVALYYWPSALIRECIAVYTMKRKLIPLLILWILIVLPLI